MALLLWSLVLLALLAGASRPGWTAYVAAYVRQLWRTLLAGGAAAGAVAVGVGGDALAGPWLGYRLTRLALPFLLPVGRWLAGPTLPRDLLALGALAAATLLDFHLPRERRLSFLSLQALHALRALQRTLPLAFFLLPLVWSWSDVLSTTAGVPGAAWYARLAAWHVPLPGPPLPEPDPRVPALGWWLAAALVAWAARDAAHTRWRRWWWSVPWAAGALAAFWRPAAVTLAAPAYVVVAAIALAVVIRDARVGRTSPRPSATPLPQERGSGHQPALGRSPSPPGRGGQGVRWLLPSSRERRVNGRSPEGRTLGGGEVWPAVRPVVQRVALLAILALALQLRWWGFDEPLGADAGGYRDAALDFHQRVAAQGTNPIALAYVRMHPVAREPLFPLLNRFTYDLLGDAKIHGQYLTIFGSVGAVAITYAFGRATLGSAAGLGAALLLATEPWHIDFSHAGLREEAALIFVYGVALLVARRHRGAWTAVGAGALAAAAMLTRIDAAPVVCFLLAGWSWAYGRRWKQIRQSWPAWAVMAALVAPLLVGYRLSRGEALAPLQSTMGGDMHAVVDPLVRRQYPPSVVLLFFARGTLLVYGETIFGALARWLAPVLGGAALPLVLAAYTAGAMRLLARGPRLLAVLSLLGAYAPPFAFIAGARPGEGPYTDRYTYLIIPAALAIFAWAVAGSARWLVDVGLTWRGKPLLVPRASARLGQRALDAQRHEGGHMATTMERPAAGQTGGEADSVVEHGIYVNGEWRPARSGQTFEVRNPATAEVLARCADAGREETREAIEAAHAAFPAWSQTPAAQRAQMLSKAAALMNERLEELARLLTQENGKPLEESRTETQVAAAFLQWNAEEARRVYGEVVPSAAPDKRVLTIKQPVGVVAAITPWNFPTSMVTRKLGPALAAGCTAVLRPARATPLVAVALFKIFDEAGVPKGVVNLVTGTKSAEMGDEMATNPLVRKLTFTGSTEVGKELLAKCAGTVKRTSLELGGHAPFIVFDDADLDKAAAAVVTSRFRNAGQTCICTNRLYAQRSIASQLAEKVASLTSKLRLGNGLDPQTQVGPLIDERGFHKVEQHVQDAVAKGGTVLAGGKPHATPNGHANGETNGQTNGSAGGKDGLSGWFYQPTVIGNATPDMLVMHEETFGPVLPIMEFDTDEEAIKLANDTPYGLAAYFFARDVGRIFRVAEGLEYGIVGANDPLPTGPHIPFGGYKESGMGRENGSHGIEEFLEVKAISIGL